MKFSNFANSKYFIHSVESAPDSTCISIYSLPEIKFISKIDNIPISADLIHYSIHNLIFALLYQCDDGYKCYFYNINNGKLIKEFFINKEESESVYDFILGQKHLIIQWDNTYFVDIYEITLKSIFKSHSIRQSTLRHLSLSNNNTNNNTNSNNGNINNGNTSEYLLFTTREVENSRLFSPFTSNTQSLRIYIFDLISLCVIGTITNITSAIDSILVNTNGEIGIVYNHSINIDVYRIKFTENTENSININNTENIIENTSMNASLYYTHPIYSIELISSFHRSMSPCLYDYGILTEEYGVILTGSSNKIHFFSFSDEGSSQISKYISYSIFNVFSPLKSLQSLNLLSGQLQSIKSSINTHILRPDSANSSVSINSNVSDPLWSARSNSNSSCIERKRPCLSVPSGDSKVVSMCFLIDCRALLVLDDADIISYYDLMLDPCSHRFSSVKKITSVDIISFLEEDKIRNLLNIVEHVQDKEGWANVPFIG